MPISRMIPLSTGLAAHVLEWDAGGDHTVVLVHGFLDLAWGWAPTVDAGLRGRYHVVAPDLRGHGDSDWVGAGGYYHFLDYLADLEALVAQVGRARVSLVGHSMGGGIAALYAGTWPDRVHKLALLEGTGPPADTSAPPDRVALWVASWRRARAKPPRTFATVAEAVARLCKYDPHLSPELAAALAEKGTRPLVDGRLVFKHDPLHGSVDPNPFRLALARSFWERVTCPVLLVDGSLSAFRHAPDEAERRARCFRHVTQAVIEGAGHMMQRHRPGEVARVIAELLA